MGKPFLNAEWRKLAMANFAINPSILEKYVPHKTELDIFNGTCYVSLVGFLFANTKLKGVKIPFHTNFEEVNLRFYVKHQEEGEWKRGVVFVKEIVPKPMLTWVANTIYKENYETMPMGHKWEQKEDISEVSYNWKSENHNVLAVTVNNTPQNLVEGSEAEFITEHYWGYTKVSNSKTLEYKVEHPQWQTYAVLDYKIDADFGELYGNEFSFLNNEKPLSVFLAEGSEIKVLDTKRI